MPFFGQRHIDVAGQRNLSSLAISYFIHPLVIKQVPLPAPPK